MERNRLLMALVVLMTLWVVGSFVLGIFPVTMTLRLYYWKIIYKLASPVQSQKSLIEVHKAQKVKVVSKKGVEYTYKYSKDDRSIIDSDSARCIACHGNMTDLDAKGKPKHYIHRKMLTAPMLNFSCTDCHKQVDIRKRSPSHVTIRVDRSLCPLCHNPKRSAIPAEWSQGKTWGVESAPQMPPLMEAHGTDETSGREWIKNHPRVGMSVGIDQCRQCHIPDSELDFCRVCHLRGGFRPDSHKVVFEAPINQIYPDNSRIDVIQTKWKGYHFVVVREALAKLGVYVDSPRNLPLDSIAKLPCGACHVLEDWCTRCHIKHNPNWLDPNVGHPAYINKYGANYCWRCHDPGGSKCVSCHSFVGQLN